MADLVSLFGQAVEEFGGRLGAIATDQWRTPTPAAEWDVRALVNHVLVENLWAPPLLEGLTVPEVGDRFDGDRLGDDAQLIWTKASGDAIVAVGEKDALERTVHVSFGDISGRDYVSQLVCDHVIHAWDLARATGTDERLNADLVEFASAYLAPQAEDWRAAGAFGPRVQVPLGADPQSQLLALTGRQP